MGLELISQKGFYGNLNGQYIGDIPIDDGNTLYADSYFVGRMKVGYLLNLNPFQIDLHAGVNNLFDAKYASMLQINNAFWSILLPGNAKKLLRRRLGKMVILIYGSLLKKEKSPSLYRNSQLGSSRI